MNLHGGVYLPRGGVPAQGGYLPGGGCTCLGGVPAWGGVPAQGGVPARGGCTCPGGYLPGGVGAAAYIVLDLQGMLGYTPPLLSRPARHAGIHTPPPLTE